MPVRGPAAYVLRGHLANPWDLRAFEDIGDEWRVSVPVLRSGAYDPWARRLDMPRALALSDLAPRRLRERAAHSVHNRYLGLRRLVTGADLVHALELGYWFTAQAARLKARLGFRLVATVWETIPFLEAYRHPLANRLRREVLTAADLYLAATEGAREGLLLEGVPEERVAVCPPGVDVDAFAAARVARPEEHVVVSPGRLVWTKGHQYVLRAVAALRRGLVRAPAVPRVLIVGAGPQEGRLRAHAAELGIDDLVDWRGSVPYEGDARRLRERIGNGARLLVNWGWEEQFGMVLAEAMAAGLPIVASRCGSIPEVLGPEGTYFFPGDWMGLARALAEGPLTRPPGERREPDGDRLTRFSSAAAAGRLEEAYRRVLA